MFWERFHENAQRAYAHAHRALELDDRDAMLHLVIGKVQLFRRAFETYRAAFRERITFGREPAPGEAMQWMLSINPYRRERDVALLREGLRILGETVEVPMLPSLGDEIEPEGPALLRAGEGWMVEYEARRAILPDLKGLADIRCLLERPGEEVHCLDLAERADDAYRGEAVLDDAARRALKARIRDLQEELAEAEDMNDPGRAGRARAELDLLVETLAKALGLGGRGRRLGDAAERARTTVTWRIRHAVKRIEAAHPALGRHFANSLRTGVFCIYRPERAVRWRLDERSVSPVA